MRYISRLQIHFQKDRRCWVKKYEHNIFVYMLNKLLFRIKEHEEFCYSVSTNAAEVQSTGKKVIRIR